MFLAKYPPETASILHRDIFWFFLKDEEFVSKTINDSNIDLEKFAASKVRQFAKKMESSECTATSYKTSCKWPPSSWSESDDMSETRSPTKQEEVETTIFQVQIKELQGGIQVNTIIKCHPTRRNLILTKLIKEKHGDSKPCRRFQVSCKEVKVQDLQQIWSFYKLVL